MTRTFKQHARDLEQTVMLLTEVLAMADSEGEGGRETGLILARGGIETLRDRITRLEQDIEEVQNG